MSTLVSNDREKSLLLLGWGIHAAGVLSLAAGAFVYHFVVSSLISHQQQRNETEAVRLEQLVATKPQVDQEFRDVNTKLSELQQRAQKMRDGIPDEPRESEFLRHVTEAADVEELKIRDYQPGAITKLDSHSQMDVRLQGEGEYRSICGFLDRISRLPRVKTVQRMQVNRSSSGSVYPVDITLTLYFGASSAG